jgi:hypothetical protein
MEVHGQNVGEAGSLGVRTCAGSSPIVWALRRQKGATKGPGDEDDGSCGNSGIAVSSLRG